MKRIDWKVFSLAFLTAGLIVAFSYWGYQASTSFHNQQKQRVAVDRRLAEQSAGLRRIARRNCLAIEQLKRGEREEAWKSWRDLDRILRILGIKKTPEIVKVAKESRDIKLKRYAKKNCPPPYPPRG